MSRRLTPLLGRRRLGPAAAVLAILALAGCAGKHSATTASQTSWTRLQGTVTVERIVYTSFDGTKVPALMAIPRATRTTGCLIWENGLGSRKEKVAPIWPGAARLGLATFSIDLRDHGERATSASELDQAVRSPALLGALVRGTLGDLKRAVDYLETRPECRHNIAYAGFSMGGMIGSVLAGQDSRLRAVVLMSTPPTWHALINATDAILPGIEHRPSQLRTALRDLSPLDPDRWVGRISPRPLLVLIGQHDPLVPPAAAHEIENAAREPKAVFNYNGSHIPFTGPAAVESASRITLFLLKHIVEPAYAGR